MQRKRIVLLLLAALLLLGGCAEKTAEIDCDAVCDELIAKYSLEGGNRYSSNSQEAGEYLDDNLVRSYYGDAAETPDFSKVLSYCVYIDESQPVNPCELGIFKLAPESDARLFVSFLKARIAAKIENAKNYPSVDTSQLKTAEFVINGDYVYYAVVKDANAEIKSIVDGKLKP